MEQKHSVFTGRPEILLSFWSPFFDTTFCNPLIVLSCCEISSYHSGADEDSNQLGCTMCQLFWFVTPCQFVWVLLLCQFFWVVTVCLFFWVVTLCQFFLFVRFAILLGCQCAHSPVLLRCVNSSGLLLFVSSFELLHCFSSSCLSGLQFFWDASLHILLCCYDVSVLLGCYCLSLLFSCYALSVLPVCYCLSVLFSCYALSVLPVCYCLSLLLSCYSVSILVVRFAILLGCQSAHSSVLFLSVSSSGSLLFVSSFELLLCVNFCCQVRNSSGMTVCTFFCVVSLCQFFRVVTVCLFFWVVTLCINFSWLSSSQFFWDAGLHIHMCCSAVSVLLGCYSASVLLSCVTLSDFSVRLSVLLGCDALPIILSCFALLVLLCCCAASILPVYYAVSIDTNLNGVISQKS